MSADIAVWCCSKCGAVYYKDFPRCPSDGAEVVLAMRDPLLDQSIGSYVIDRLIGEGGMGRVYAAHHATLAAKRYAIKVLLGDAAATTSMRKRFRQEAESASRLSHPNIVQVHDFGEMPGGLPYIVMDYVEGRPLTDMIADTPMDPPRVIRFARALCEGLAHAHEANVVHRDLKPDNVMVVVDDAGIEVPRITDFGLATTIDEGQPRITTTGMAMGTPAYAAPEQMAGRRVDHRADLYALGMTMFEMLTGGDLPFEGHPMETVAAKASREARRVREVAPTLELPPGLEDLVAHLVRRRTADRPASARGVIAELDQIVLASAVDERAATVIDAARSQPVAVTTDQMVVRRSRLPWVAGALAAVGLAGGFAWSQLRGRDATSVASASPITATAVTPRPAPIPTAPPARAAIEPAPTAEPDKDLVVDPTPVPHKQRRHNQGRPHEAVKKPKLVASGPEHDAVSKHDVAPKPAPIPATPAPTPTPTPAPAPEPPKPATIVATLSRVDVEGALSQGAVRSAVERVMPAIRQCSVTAAHTVHVHFTIDEARRPRDARATGAAASCVMAALVGVRTASAPDVGDAVVDVEVAFVAKP